MYNMVDLIDLLDVLVIFADTVYCSKIRIS